MKKSLLSLLLLISSVSSCDFIDELMNRSSESEEKKDEGTKDDNNKTEENKESKEEGKSEGNTEEKPGGNTDKPSEEGDQQNPDDEQDGDKEQEEEIIPPDATTYQITWVVDGVEVRTDTVVEGRMPSFGSTPTKDTTDTTIYTFDRWEPAVVNAVADATYTAVFTEEARKYNISFEINGVIVDTEEYSYNDYPSFKNPNNIISDISIYHPNDNDYWKFKGWDPAIKKVSQDQKYVAILNKMEYRDVTYYAYTYVTGGSSLDYPSPLYSTVDITTIGPAQSLRMFEYIAETNTMKFYKLFSKENSDYNYAVITVQGKKIKYGKYSGANSSIATKTMNELVEI